MDDQFWINPLKLDRDDVDSNNASIENVSETRRQRSADSDPVESINSFFSNAQIAYDQIEDLKSHMLDVRHPEIDPDSLSSHRIEFLKVPEEVITDNDATLKAVFQHLQKFAVALFQVLKETEETETGSEYHQKLKITKDKMIQMIADIQLAMILSEETPHQDVTYEMLPPHMRNRRGYSLRALRDFMVIRDYSDFLENILNQKDSLLGFKP